MTEPIERFSKVMYQALNAFSPIYTFRQTIHLAIDASKDRLLNVERLHAENLFNSSYGDRFFTDKEGFLQLVGGAEGWARLNTEKRIAQFMSIAESSSLIFAHSILDAIAYDLCLVTAAIEPKAWFDNVRNKKVNFEDIVSKTSSLIGSEVTTGYVESLERESLIKKIDQLFAICKPPKDFRPSDEYIYDKEKLVTLDTMRHDMVHGDLPADAEVSASDIRYIQQTAVYLCAMVSERFGVKADIKKALIGLSSSKPQGGK